MRTNVWTEGLATIRKALTASNSGSTLLQPVINATMPILVEYENLIRLNLPRKKGEGAQWIINRRTPGTRVYEWKADADSVEVEDDTVSYEQFLFPYRTLLTRGKVTRKLQDTVADYIDVLMKEVERKILEFREEEIKSYLVGSNDKYFDGIKQLCPDYQTLDAENKPLSLDLLDEAIDLNAGSSDMIIMTRKRRRDIYKFMIGEDRHSIDTVKVNGGRQVMSYCGIPIYSLSCEWLDEIYFIDTNHLWAGEITPVRMLPMAKTGSLYDEFEIFCDETLVLRNPLCISKIINLSDMEQ